MSAAEGPGRRLTLEEEQRGAELFAAGLSTRAVALELGVGNGTAARLKQRLAERAAAPPTEADAPGITRDHDEHQDDGAELEQLRAQREALAAEVGKYVSRADASMQAVAALEEERILTLAEGRDAQSLRARRRDAEDDARDSADAAEIARGRLGEVDRKIQDVVARQADRQLRAELAAAIEDNELLLAGIGARQRQDVLAVRNAAEDFTATYTEMAAAQRRVGELRARVALGGPAPVVPAPVSTAISLPGDVVGPQPVALLRAIREAAAGNVAAVAQRLGECNGWLPPDPSLLAAERERMQRLYAPAQARPAPALAQPLDPRFGASVSVDQHGSPLRAPDPERPRPQQVVRPGGLGFEPWPR